MERLLTAMRVRKDAIANSIIQNMLTPLVLMRDTVFLTDAQKMIVGAIGLLKWTKTYQQVTQ
eukprot:2517259-Rhodomonas_salina.1